MPAQTSRSKVKQRTGTMHMSLHTSTMLHSAFPKLNNVLGQGDANHSHRGRWRWRRHLNLRGRGYQDCAAPCINFKELECYPKKLSQGSPCLCWVLYSWLSVMRFAISGRWKLVSFWSASVRCGGPRPPPISSPKLHKSICNQTSAYKLKP